MSKKTSRKNRDEASVDKSPHVHQRDKFKHEFRINQRDDLTDRQKDFLKLALDKETKIIFLQGPAGTSKTFITVLAALELMQMGRVSDLIYVRAAVESSDHSMGFLPGDADEKFSPYIAPLLDKLEELLDANTVNLMKKENRFSAKPIGFLRGLNWNAKAVIADEAQNFTLNELTTLMTRIGQFSKLFICGDLMQSDIDGQPGLPNMIKMFSSADAQQQGIHVFEFDESDIVRSQLVRFIVKTIEENKRYNTEKHPAHR